ncbi:MAG TPA: hybrid sensor histidine kinase/response regulator, partial [Gammaproteobacteria bacterium]|nr:hybrid sensor histidine kinase/response regulator [Gammaproteobacteria bacterium]
MNQHSHEPKNILIVDDDPIVRSVLTDFLLSKNFLVHVASSGEHALTLIDSIQTDLILLDVNMPGIDGMDTCRLIRSKPDWQLIPIIMITGAG